MLPRAFKSHVAANMSATDEVLCPVCMTVALQPETQCTLRCGHALCNRCLPLLHSPLCPICRQHVWRGREATPWLLASDPSPTSFETLFEHPSPPSSHTSAETNDEAVRIPVALVTRQELRHLFLR